MLRSRPFLIVYHLKARDLLQVMVVTRMIKGLMVVVAIDLMMYTFSCFENFVIYVHICIFIIGNLWVVLKYILSYWSSCVFFYNLKWIVFYITSRYSYYGYVNVFLFNWKFNAHWLQYKTSILITLHLQIQDLKFN